MREELKYAGILPPLATPQHKLEVKIKDLKDGEFREAVITETSKKAILCDVGLKKQIKLLTNKKKPHKKRSKDHCKDKKRKKRGLRIPCDEGGGTRILGLSCKHY